MHVHFIKIVYAVDKISLSLLSGSPKTDISLPTKELDIDSLTKPQHQQLCPVDRWLQHNRA